MAGNITRWDPFREMVSLRDAMDSLFENALTTPLSGAQGSSSYYMPVDVSENEDSFVVRASVPGVNPEDMNVTVTDNVLTIEGQIKHEEEKENARYHVRERRWGSFNRQITLPMPVNADAVQTDFSNGILTLTLPKSEESKPKRIAIKTNGQKTLEGQSRRT